VTNVGFTVYDPETKPTIVAVEEPITTKSKKVWQVRRSIKSMLIVFFYVKGIVHREFVPPNTMVSSDFDA
jgi:hypothetical protein